MLQDELLKVDTQLLEELDKKVADQQAIMQSSGVPGFFVTNDPKVNDCFSHTCLKFFFHELFRAFGWSK